MLLTYPRPKNWLKNCRTLLRLLCHDGVGHRGQRGNSNKCTIQCGGYIRTNGWTHSIARVGTTRNKNSIRACALCDVRCSGRFGAITTGCEITGRSRILYSAGVLSAFASNLRQQTMHPLIYRSDLAVRCNAGLGRVGRCLSNTGTATTIAEDRTAAEDAIKAEAQQHPLMQAAMASFPNAKIIDIRTAAEITERRVRCIARSRRRWDPFEES